MPTMIAVTGGTFQIGANRPGHLPKTITVGDYYLSNTAVPLSEWESIRDTANGLGYSIPIVGDADGPNHPVQGVSLPDCAAWCNALSQSLGRTPRYLLPDLSIYKGGALGGAGAETLVVDQSANGFRLPHEPEYEWAAREGGTLAGNVTTGSVNSRSAWPRTYNLLEPDPTLRGSWTLGPPRTVQVDAGTPNALGFYHLIGNAWEWTQHLVHAPGEYDDDEADARYSIIRGGSFDDLDLTCLPNVRQVCEVNMRLTGLGFRVARDA
ncbi:MAG: formylglycine-generating enzyme family protein [Candidatus Deferrimicrobiaceae bacterium]